MKIEQLYTNCLAHAAYYVESNGEAAIFDPLREVDQYIQKARNNNAIIKYVFETHFHADFVSGHLELMKKTGAKIVFGPTAKPGYDAIVATDNQVFSLGKIKIKVIHTPGHTMESTTYLVMDEQGQDYAIITGDTLFIGDVGRPDLAQHVNKDLDEKKLAGYLYDSLRNKIMPLNDNLIVYPNHGAGSACGKMMSKETTDTLGHQKLVNYALDPSLTKEAFIDKVLNGLTTPPGYFPQNVLMNLQGYEHLDEVLARGNHPLTLAEFEKAIADDAVLILDTRDAGDFAKGFIPGSINVGVNGNFAQWVGEMIPSVRQQIVLVTEPGKEKECMIRLSRVGYDHTIGYLEGGFTTWLAGQKKYNSINRINASQLQQMMDVQDIALYDVRKRSEFESQHVHGAVNIPLNEMNRHFNAFPTDKKIVLYCAGGYRSMIAASVLMQNGTYDVTDVIGGFAEIKNSTTLPLSTFNLQTTLL